MHRSLAGLVVLSALAFGAAPASAQPTATIQPFNGRTAIAFDTQPIGAAECNVQIPIRFTNLTMSTSARYLDFWRAASNTAMCESGALRAMTTQVACVLVSTPGNTFTNANMFDMNVTAAQLFGADACNGVETTNTFYIFDSQSNGDRSSTFTTWGSLTIQIDTLAPSAPTLADGIAGDTTVAVSWTNPADIRTQGGIRVYVDPDGCSGDGGTSTLVAGAEPPSSAAFEQMGQAFTTVQVPTSQFGWSTSGTYTERAAIAVSVLDSALNPSVLSNVVCAEHVRVSGFWNTYCAGLVGPDGEPLSLDECTAHYRGCSVAVPSRRVDLAMLAVLSIALGVFVRRRSR